MHKIGRLQIYLILTLALIVHLTLLDHIKIFGIKPDLMLIPVIFFGLFLGAGKGLESGLAAGILKDLFALDFLGINTCILGITGFLAGALGTKFSSQSKNTHILLVIFLTAFSMTLHYILASRFSKWVNLGFGEYFGSAVVPTSIYTTLLSIPIFSKLMNRYEMSGSEDYL